MNDNNAHTAPASSEKALPRPEEIRKQASRILSSPAFEASERNRAFFSFVIKEAVAGRAEHLKGPTIARKVFERGEDFDAAHDPVVRMEARKLRAALNTYYLRDGARDPIRIQIPKGSYVPHFDYQGSATTTPGQEEQLPKIVVMPFELLSHDATQRYLAVGITEEITTALSRYKNLRVVASGSARHLHEQGLSEIEVGQNLGVRFLLQGSVQQHGPALKISAKLIDIHSGTLRWSERFRRQLKIEEIFELQEEIARAVAAKIGGEFGVVATQIYDEARQKTPPSLTAYEALLQFYHYKHSISPDKFHRTFDLVKATLDQEPEYGELWSAFSNLYADNYVLEFYPIEDFPLEGAERHAQKGVELAPERQAAHMALAYIYLLRNDLKRYAEEATYGYRLNPNNAYYTAVCGYCELLAGRWQQGLPLLEEGCRLNPYHPGFFHLGFFLYHYAHHDYAKAYQEALKINLPGVFFTPLLQAAALGQLGRSKEAEAKLEALLQLRPDFPEHAYELAARIIKAEGQVEHILKGLQKAGLGLKRPDTRGQLIPFRKAHSVG